MKRSLSLIALILAVIMLVTACGGNGGVTTTTAANTTQATSGTTTEATTQTTATTAKPAEPKKSIKILAIGNSFSVDAMEHLWYLLYEQGYTEIILGNLYIGGCSLDTHWDNIQNDTGAYQYYISRFSTWSSTKNYKLSTALKSQEWDYITIQQVSQNSGMPDTFANLQNILDYVNANKKKADAKVYWHMTWAYQQDSSHNGFANYGFKQDKMYEAITNAVKEGILKNDSIDGFIPSGTTIQNLRTSYLGDTLTRDGYHLSNGLGRYAAAMTWAKILGGGSIDDIDWVPKSFADDITPHLAAIKEAVNNAAANPLEVTKSKFTTNPNPKPEEPKLPTVVTDTSKTEALTDADKAVLTAQGLDPTKYAVLKMTPVVCAFYNSTSSATLNKTASNSPQFWATNEKFSTSLIPVGSVITIANGYQYRPEGFQTETGKNTGTRPANVSTAVVKVDANWWKGFNFRAFNVSRLDGANVSEADTGALRILVPIAE